MALKYKIFNSFGRGKKFLGFAKKKLLALDLAEIPIKTYIINGYRIVVKAITDLVLVYPPPGVYVYYFERSTYTTGVYNYLIHANPIQLYFSENYANGREAFREAGTSVYPIGEDVTEDDWRFDFAGWVGRQNIIPLGDDAVLLDFLPNTRSNPIQQGMFHFIQDSLSDDNCGVRSGAISITYSSMGAASLVFTNSAWGKCVHTAYYFYEKSQINPYLFYTITEVNGSPGSVVRGFKEGTLYQNFPFPTEGLPTDYWKNATPHWNTLWSSNGKLKLFSILEAPYILKPTGYIFVFYELSAVTAAVSYIGSCLLDKVLEITDLYPEYNISDITDLMPTPHWLSEEFRYSKNVVIPITGDEVLLFHYQETLNALCIRVKPNNTAILSTSYALPYVYRSHSIPICELVDFVDGLFLYWEECLYGREDDATEIVNIENFKYGYPFTNAWVAMPAPPTDTYMVSFTIIKFSTSLRVLHAIFYREDPDPNNKGMYIAYYDSSKHDEWQLYSRIAPTRLERLQATVYGMHPNAKYIREYTGTRYSWPFLYVADDRAGVLA